MSDYIPVDQRKCKAPPLHCKNGGISVCGEKPPDMYDHLDDITSAWLENHLNNHDSKRDAGMYCQCADGWTDTYCETKVVICEENEHLCLSGGSCIQNGLDEDEEEYYCLCGKVTHTHPEVGNMCDFVTVKSCELNERYADHPFCVNGGECIDIMQNHMYGHTGCKCPSGFNGEHCENVVGLHFDNEEKKEASTNASVETSYETTSEHVSVFYPKKDLMDTSIVESSINESNDIDINSQTGSDTSMKFLGVGVIALVVLPILIKLILRRSKKSRNSIENVPVSEPYRDVSSYRDNVDTPTVEDTEKSKDDEEEEASLQII